MLPGPGGRAGADQGGGAAEGGQSVDSLLAEDPAAIGDYRLLGRLGAGGMGLVYLGRSPAGRLVAIKTVHARFAAEPGFRARFRREVTAAKAVSGAFTAALIDADPQARKPWLATEFLAGCTLQDAIDEHGPMPGPAVFALGAGLAEALASMHRAGVVHRDLKPTNVMLTRDGPRVIDFGIAHTTEVSMITQAGHVVGSPGYLSPEQATGDATGPPSDVFSLGAVLVFAATGQGPYGAAAPAALIFRIAHGRPDLTAVTDPRLRELPSPRRSPAARH
jgi:serine/threonine protein kinase